MPNELRQRLNAIIAAIGINDGANKGFWRIQPRDDEGQWMEMGGGVFFRFRTGKGNLVVGNAKGIYVGPTGKPGRARVLIEEGNDAGLKPGVYDLDSRNLTQIKAVLPEEALKDLPKQERTDKFGKPVKSLEDSQLPTKDELEANATEPTADDERLARGELTPEEKAAEQDGREKSPIADLPAGFEAENPEEVKKMLRDSGIEPDEFDKPEAASDSEGSGRDPVDEIFADVAYNGDTDKSLDDLISLVSNREAGYDRDSDPDVKKTKAININRGDVIRSRDGRDGTVLDVKIDVSMGGKSVIRVQNDDGSISEQTIDPAGDLYVVKSKKGKVSKPAKPARPAKPAQEEAPKAETPEAPTTRKDPTPELEPVTPSEPDAPNPVPDRPDGFPPSDRIDNGEEFELDELSPEARNAARKKKAKPLLLPDGTPEYYVDEDGKLAPAYDPFSLMNVLAEIYPNAKFSPDGLSLILARMKDKDGRIFELRASNSGMKAVSYAMRWTDPNTGEYEELIHYDTRHAVPALFTATNGPDGLLERLMGKGKWANLTHGSWSAGPDASLRERAKWFTYKQKMFTAERMATDMANGRTETYHVDRQNWGNVRKSEIKSLWDSIEEFWANPQNPEAIEDFYLRLELIFGSIPMTNGAHKAAMRAIRKEFKSKYGSVATPEQRRQIDALITNASVHAKGKGFSRDKDPGYRAIPWASKNRHKPVEVGQVVRYTNRVGDESVLRVVARVDSVTAVQQSDDAFDYGDYVVVEDAQGNRMVLNAMKMEILNNQGSSLTDYIPNPIGEELRRRRIEQGKLAPRGSKPNPVPGSTAVASAPAPEFDQPDLVDDLIEGDTLFDRSGEPIGEIIAVEPTQDNEGNNGFAFLVVNEDGDEVVVFYPQGTEISPKKD